MIDVGSRVAARLSCERGTVTRREFDPWSRDWWYDVEWADGTSTRVPFLALIEVTCAGCKLRVKIDVDRAGAGSPLPVVDNSRGSLT